MTDKDLAARFLTEGYETRNYEAAGRCLSPDYLDHSPAGARGRREAVEILKAVSGMFEELELSIEDLFSEGGMVAARVRFRAVHTGTCMGIPPTGRRITFEALEHFKIADGLIRESWGYWPDREIRRLLTEPLPGGGEEA